MKEQMEGGGFRSGSDLAGSGKPTELAAFRLGSCSITVLQEKTSFVS